jgi:hypothetical protein
MALRLTGARCAGTRVHPSFWVVERENDMVCLTITRVSDAREHVDDVRAIGARWRVEREGFYPF